MGWDLIYNESTLGHIKINPVETIGCLLLYIFNNIFNKKLLLKGDLVVKIQPCEFVPLVRGWKTERAQPHCKACKLGRFLSGLQGANQGCLMLWFTNKY